MKADGVLMRKLGDKIKKPGMSNYIANAQREDMIKTLRETADRLERKQDFPTPENN